MYVFIYIDGFVCILFYFNVLLKKNLLIMLIVVLYIKCEYYFVLKFFKFVIFDKCMYLNVYGFVLF